MSRAAVRTALATSLGNVTGLFVFPRAPKVIPATKRPAVVVHLPEVREYREANQAKIRTHRVQLGVDFASPKTKSEDAVSDFEDLIESIEGQLRSDKTLGGAVLRSAEPAMTTTATFPVTDKDGARTYVSGVIEFEVDELVEPA